MKKLITFGCSHTTGANLDDNFNLPLKVSKYAWGNIVAKEFNLEHDNKGYGGAANRYILYRILNYTYTNSDMVCILWSHPHRKTFWSNDEKKELWGPWKFQTINGSDKLRHNLDEKYIGECEKWYHYFYSVYDSCLDTIQCIHHAKLYLDSLNIPNYHILQSDNKIKDWDDVLPRQYVLDTNPPEFFNIPNIPIQNTFFNRFRRIPPLALDKQHAGIKGQKLFGKAVIETIKNNDTISLEKIFPKKH